MRKGFLGSLATLLTGVGLASAQPLPGPENPTPPPASSSDSAKPRGGAWMSGFGSRPSAESSSSSTSGSEPAKPSTPSWNAGFGSSKDGVIPASKTEGTLPVQGASAGTASGVFWKTSYKVDKNAASTSDQKPIITPEGISVPDEPNAFDSTLSGDKKLGQKALEEKYYPSSHIWVSTEYLYGWIKDGKLPGPVLTTGGANLGTLGAPDTSVALNSVNFNYGQAAGYRVSAGVSDQNSFNTHTVGFEATCFLLERRTAAVTHVDSDANGNPLLSRPIFNPQVLTGQGLIGSETVLRVSGPDAFDGHMVFGSNSRLWGVEGNFIASRMLFGPDLIIGGRYACLDENLLIGQTTTVLPNGVAGFNGESVLVDSVNGIPSGPPNTLQIIDVFTTRNQFYGGQIGLQNESHYKNFFVLWQAKVAFGVNHEHLTINGGTALFSGGTVRTTSGGAAAVSSNIGKSSNDEFAYLPEVGLNMGVDIFSFLRVYAGYQGIYWSDVARPGDSVSRTINPGLVPSSLQFGNNQGVNMPFPQFHQTSYWAHGINAGIAIRY